MKKQNKLKRPKDELKQRPKKLKTSSKPKYISEYISESQSIKPTDQNQPQIGQSLLPGEPTPAVSQQPAEMTKKEKIRNEKLRAQKEKYFKEQLWEEHCYTPKLPWLPEITSQVNEQEVVADKGSKILAASPEKKQVEGTTVKLPAKIKAKRSSALKDQPTVANAVPNVSVKTEQKPLPEVQQQQQQASKFKQRTKNAETEIAGRIFTEGIDREDIDFLRKAFTLFEDSLSIQKSDLDSKIKYKMSI